VTDAQTILFGLIAAALVTMAVVQVVALMEDEAKVEIETTAVIP